MAGYALPTSTSYVSCSWQCHRDRRPPSTEAGTDYGCHYGSILRAVEAGVITDVKRSNSGAMGRFVEYRLLDGRTTRSLHMAEVRVNVGQRVTRGQALGLSGASGFGDDWYYGPHDHQTLWAQEAWSAPTIDFALYVGDVSIPTPPPDDDEEDEDVAKNSGAYYKRVSDGATVYIVFNPSSGWWMEYLSGSVVGGNSNAIAATLDTGSYANVTESWIKALKGTLDQIKPRNAITVNVAGDDA